MDLSDQLVSPKQVARAIGVSESSLKRWCDCGLIGAVRTAGGHRKMSIADVVNFVRQHDYTFAEPELLGLPPTRPLSQASLPRARDQLTESLLAGNEPASRQIVFELYMAKHSLSLIFDDVLAGAFHTIGERQACDEAEIYEERKSCEIALRILYDLERIQPAPPKTFLAVGSSAEGDHYSIPTRMAEIIARDAGFHASSLGSNIPFASLVGAVKKLKPKLFWLSVSHHRGEEAFLAGFESLSIACGAEGAALVVGGRALDESLRKQMKYAAYCDTMQQLENFATTLHRGLAKK